MSLRLTLAETESYLRKASRARGLDWGIAEEAGKAARWLAAFNLPGPETLLAHLQQLSGDDYRQFFPDCTLDPWQAPGGLLCPIITGAAIADRSAQMLDGHRFQLAAKDNPGSPNPSDRGSEYDRENREVPGSRIQKHARTGSGTSSGYRFPRTTCGTGYFGQNSGIS